MIKKSNRAKLVTCGRMWVGIKTGIDSKNSLLNTDNLTKYDENDRIEKH